MKSKWKIGFLILFGINLLLGIVLFSLAALPAKIQNQSEWKQPSGEYVTFRIQSNKNDLNLLINQYLQKQTANSPIDYQVRLGNKVELHGILPLLGENLDMQLMFEPKVLNNGDLALEQKSMAIGRLNLPVDYVLKFISANYKLPSGVEIRPNDRIVYINMQQLKLKSDLKIQVNKFNLQKDDIAFSLLVPVK